MRHFRLPAIAALAFAVAVPAAALAAKPKHGYYIDAPKQIYIVVNAKRTALTSFQAPCLVKGTDGKLTPNTGFTLASKHPKLSPSGSFSYDGKVKLGEVIVSAKFTGTFTGTKIKGTITIDPKTTCVAYRYSAKYYGVNPGG